MLDFFKIETKNSKNGLTVYPDFKITGTVKDLMVQGKDFYAIWNEETGLWSRDEYDVQMIVDNAIDDFIDSNPIKDGLIPLYMCDYSSGMWKKYKDYIKNIPTNFHQLDAKIVFANDPVKKSEYISRRLPYEMKKGKMTAYNELMSVLYEPEERKKLEWAIGAIISGDSKKIQKFIAITGDPGKGKGTFLNILMMMFDGYVSMFNAKELANGNNAFAGDAFANNPLIAIQTDGDLSKIQDNTLLNSIISHEKIIINQKFKSKYEIKLNSFLFMATNGDIAITDYSSGLKRRLIDVYPSNRIIEDSDKYDELMEEIENEKGAIAYHCLKLYEQMGKDAYKGYRSKEQESRTNIMYNFVESELLYDPLLKDSGYITLKRAYELYKSYCEDSGFKGRLPLMKFKTELKHYFYEFKERYRVENDHREYSCYIGLKVEEFDVKKFVTDDKPVSKIPKWLELKEQHSLLDDICKDDQAQYEIIYMGKKQPAAPWNKVETSLKDIDVTKIHYLKPKDEHHIFIDFDIKDDNGDKQLELSLEKAKDWPKTYAETSQSGNGLHLHYIYDGDPNELSNIFDEHIEIKKCTGGSAFRRKVLKCNNLPIAHLSVGDLPIKEKKVFNEESFKSEESLRNFISDCIKKRHHGATTPEVHFIKKALDDMYASGKSYDVRNLKPSIINFAASSTNQSEICLKLVSKMHFHSNDIEDIFEIKEEADISEEVPIVFFDIECFPNLFLICWKELGGNKITPMINPSSSEVKELTKYRLVGFNNKSYDNHMIYAAILGYSNRQLYNLSKKLTNDDKNVQKEAQFKQATNLSYTDIYDYATTKQSLKKWEIELGIHHQELGLDWDKPVPEELWPKVIEYCNYDVEATEAVWNATQSDFEAREILADLTNGTVNTTTNTLITKLVLEGDNDPELIYTDLTTGNQYGRKNRFVGNDPNNTFPEYTYIPGPENKGRGRNMLRGIDLGFGGYVFAVPGIYYNVALLDVQNMHGESIERLNMFGDHTQNYANLRTTRNCIKVGDFETPKSMFNGKLEKYLQDESQASNLSSTLKLPCNQTYGLTQTTYPNVMKDERNKNNIVAVRGAIMMKLLQDELEKKGFPVCHIKTDSCKVPGATPEIIKFIQDFAAQYGYVMEHECTYEKICLVNDAVYIAKYDDQGIRNKGGKHANEWTATGTEFQVPYVFKTLFSHEVIEFADLCETKSVARGGAIYLDYNETLDDVTFFEDLKVIREKLQNGDKTTKKAVRLAEEYSYMSDDELDMEIAKGHEYQFVGKVGAFCPVVPGSGGGIMVRMKDNKYYAVTGTKGYRWLESEQVKEAGLEDKIDMSYYRKLVDDAIDHINEYGSFEEFVNN